MRKEKPWQNKNAWKIYKLNWQLAREIVELRDGYECQIPECYVRVELQLDHVFSRDIKTLFFDLWNLGYLCPEHHAHKSFRKGQWVDKLVNDLCKKRAGQDWWDAAILRSKQSCPGFRNVGYQERINEQLQEQYKYYKVRSE